MDTFFLFMDEKKSEHSLPKGKRATKLTGLMIPSGAHRTIRDGFYCAVNRAIPTLEGVDPGPVEVHAADLFRSQAGVDDAARIGFVNDLVDIILLHKLPVLNCGYYTASLSLFRNEADIFGLCFMNFLWRLAPVLDEVIIWPVMERDGTKEQDQMFAGTIRNVDHYVARLPHTSGSISINYHNLAEVLYSSKISTFGAMCDVICYILHKRWLRSIGCPLSPYAGALADVAERLKPVLWLDDIIWMKMR